MSNIYHRTPLLQSHKNQTPKVYYKMECHQPTGSFKIRGMEVLCRHHLANGQRRFIASSGGNSSFSMAYVAKKLGAEIKVVVPKTTSIFMIDKIRNLGVEVEVYGKVWDETHEYTLQQAQKHNAVYVSPFDDALLWEGHASMIDECAQQMPQPSKIVLSVGGGGLLCGVLEGIKRNQWQDSEIIAVETLGAASFQQSMEKNSLVELDSIETIASSLGAKKVTEEALIQSKNFKVTPFLVSDKDTVRASIAFLNEYNVLVEPACGAALSYPMLQGKKLDMEETVLVIVCGGVSTSFEKLKEYELIFLSPQK